MISSNKLFLLVPDSGEERTATTDEESEAEELENRPCVNLGNFCKTEVEKKNSQLAVGYKHQRSFVVRGDRIGVFKHDEDDKLLYDGMISHISTPSGKAFSPQKMMLHNQDSSMILMDANQRNRLYRMDLEYGKIIDEWVNNFSFFIFLNVS